MACPRCGGISREPIAPGYWRCLSLVTVAGPGPGLTNPTGGPLHIAATNLCGCEYQDGPGPTADTCHCGTFAIGFCHTCHTAVCGTHSTMSQDSRRLCGQCVANSRTQAEERRIATHATAVEEWERERSAWAEDALERLEGLEPIARILVTAHAGRPPGPGLLGNAAGDAPVAMRELLPELHAANGAGTWTDREISEWFAARCKAPTGRFRRTHKTIFGGYKDRFLPCWGADGWSTVWASKYHRDARPSAWWAGVGTDGERLFDPGGQRRNDDHFSYFALSSMAKMLKLKELPPRPKRPYTREG